MRWLGGRWKEQRESFIEVALAPGRRGNQQRWPGKSNCSILVGRQGNNARVQNRDFQAPGERHAASWPLGWDRFRRPI